MKIKDIAQRFIPPVCSYLKRVFQTASKNRPEWEYLPDGWRTHDEAIKGWDIQAIAETQKSKWMQFLSLVRGQGPLGIAHEAPTLTASDLPSHNGAMVFGYVLARTARGKDRISLLDWGGGIGHYFEFGKALLPEVEIEYYCKDMPRLCAVGRELAPAIHFVADDDSCFLRKYDLVMASTSLHYSEDWKTLLGRLGNCARKYLYIAHLPVVPKAPSFVFVQRPYAYGYGTEYIGWCLNRQEFLDAIDALGLKLIREFIYGHAPRILNAPEQNEYRGFLFQTGQSKSDSAP